MQGLLFIAPLKHGGGQACCRHVVFVLIFALWPIFLIAGNANKPCGLKTVIASCGDTCKVKASWNLNAEPDIIFYTVYRGISSRNYSIAAKVNHPDTTVTIGGIAVNTIYFFAVTATDTVGNESGYSYEVQFLIEDTTGFHAEIADGFDSFNVATWTRGTNAANITTVENGVLALRSNAREAGWVHTVNRFPLRNCTVDVYFAKTGGSCNVGFSPTVQTASVDGIVSEANMLRIYIAHVSATTRGIYLQEKKAGIVTMDTLLIADTRFQTSPVALRLKFSETMMQILYAFAGEFVQIYQHPVASIYGAGSFIELSSYFTSEWGEAHIDSFALRAVEIEPNKFDFTKDGVVDIFDWIFLLRHIGINNVSPDYLAELDLNLDGWIDGMDKAIFARLSGFV